MRTGAGFGVVLDGEGRKGLVAETLDGAVVEVDMRAYFSSVQSLSHVQLFVTP